LEEQKIFHIEGVERDVNHEAEKGGNQKSRQLGRDCPFPS